MKNVSNTVSPPSFCFAKLSVRQISVLYAGVLLPQLIMLGILGDWAALCVIAVAVAASVAAELMENCCRRRKTLRNGSAVVCGLLIGFFCPETMPLWCVFATSFFAVVAARCVFGGLGSCWFHPAVAAVALLYVAVPEFFPDMLVTPSSVEFAGTAFVPGETVPVCGFDVSVTEFLNRSFLKFFGIRIPSGYITLFADAGGVVPAVRFNLFTMAASIVLIAFSVIDWIVPAVFLTVYAALVYFFSLTFLQESYAAGDILFALLSGGTLFAAFFILSDASLLPVTRLFRILYAVAAGCAAFLLAGPGGTYTGIIFAVVIMNCLNPLLCRWESVLLDRRTARIAKWRNYEPRY